VRAHGWVGAGEAAAPWAACASRIGRFPREVSGSAYFHSKERATGVCGRKMSQRRPAKLAVLFARGRGTLVVVRRGFFFARGRGASAGALRDPARAGVSSELYHLYAQRCGPGRFDPGYQLLAASRAEDLLRGATRRGWGDRFTTGGAHRAAKFPKTSPLRRAGRVRRLGRGTDGHGRATARLVAFHEGEPRPPLS